MDTIIAEYNWIWKNNPLISAVKKMAIKYCLLSLVRSKCFCAMLYHLQWYSWVLCAEGSDITAWVWVWGTVTNDWSLYMAQVTDFESQLRGTVMIAAWMFVMTISKSWQVFSPIHPPFLFFNSLFTFVLKPFKLSSILSSIFISYYLIHFFYEGSFGSPFS